ncbi:hypothetical protein BXT86_05710 [candidate division WOR-3 bacterium 4484_100]|uniref:DUF2520 domain-containing protein n=1 Tax=candidate division WOR-3 bacterium 4484_100 TaxID=1936077 RepID=A0A1V4QED5_UNCW3|nr:MAG: hypothetical protein BXT86_05710 [candidate division WOR-3 bacterium 4484_100]
MKLGLIGCGRVGISIFYLLKKRNKIVGLYDINKKNLARAKKLLKYKKNLKIDEICKQSDALFIATPDDKIVKTYKNIRKYITAPKFIFHFSGSLSSKIIPKSKNIYRASIHPFATFPEVVLTPRRYFLFFEGDPPALRAVRKIFPKENFLIKRVNPRLKNRYHLIGVFSSNLLIGYLTLIRDLAKEIGWKDREFYEIVIPIIESTIKNVKKYGLKDGLSGPLKRGDKGVIKKHLETLRAKKGLNRLYKFLSSAILNDLVDPKAKKSLLDLFKN